MWRDLSVDCGTGHSLHADTPPHTQAQTHLIQHLSITRMGGLISRLCIRKCRPQSMAQYRDLLENVAITNALQLEAVRATPVLCCCNYDADVRSHWTNPLPYYSVFLLLIHYFTMWLDLWPLTLNICSVSPVMWWNSEKIWTQSTTHGVVIASGVRMKWAGWKKSRATSAGAPEFQAFKK